MNPIDACYGQYKFQETLFTSPLLNAASVYYNLEAYRNVKKVFNSSLSGIYQM